MRVTLHIVERSSSFPFTLSLADPRQCAVHKPRHPVGTTYSIIPLLLLPITHRRSSPSPALYYDRDVTASQGRSAARSR